jgi:transposase-like protein
MGHCFLELESGMSDRAGYWREMLKRQTQSDLTVRDFCEMEGVSTASFYNWRRRLAETKSVADAPAFVPISVARQPQAISCVEIVLSADMTIRVPEGTARQTIVDVL